jgi:hypothetical protein
VLLGWYGASDKHLAKYSRLLAARGYGSVRGTMSGAAIFLPLMWPRVSFATALLELLDGLGGGEQQLVFYVFSNGEQAAAAKVWPLGLVFGVKLHVAYCLAGAAGDFCCVMLCMQA